MSEEVSKQAYGLSANALKLIAIAAMTVDHIAWKFFAVETVPGQLMHIVGRLTLPIMCFFIAEGYYHTKNLRRYILRMAIFAVISNVAYSINAYDRLPISFNNGSVSIQPYQSIMTNLLFGLISLAMIKSEKIPKALSIGLTVMMLFLSFFMDWSFYVILCVLAYGLNYGNRRRQMLWMSGVSIVYILSRSLDSFFDSSAVSPLFSLYRLGIFLSIPLLLCYNGNKGRGGKVMKWMFYAYYPAHLLIIAAVAKIH